MKLLFFTICCSWFAICFSKSNDLNSLGSSDNYSVLLKQCQQNSCCESSVRSAEKSKGIVLNDDAPYECPKGYSPNGLKCVGSRRWCEPKSSH